MKWTNRGHQLDALGEKYLMVKKVFLYGTDEKAKKAYDFLCWLGVEKDLDISFVLDITILNQLEERSFCGRPVIAFQTDLCELVQDNPAACVIALPWIAQINERAILERLGADNIFYLLASHNRRDNFIQNFICIWMMYRHGKLLSHWTNFLTTSRCNLNCKHCLNFNEFIKKSRDITFSEFKENVDTLFSKYDYVYSLHLCGGEPMLVRDLPKFISYIKENYGDRVFDFFIITNGTIIPNDEIISAVKSVNGSFLLDDYSDTVSTGKLSEICAMLQDEDVAFVVNKADRWFDLDIDNTDNSTLSEDELELHKDNCNSYLQEFGEKRFYACCYQQYAHRVGKADLDEADYIEIESSSKMEILEFRQGYSAKGYTSLCKNCKGIGPNAKYAAAAVQIPRSTISSSESRSTMTEQSKGLVSVCVPVYNTAKYLSRCIKSLIAQTYQKLEIILINDGSTDHSALICEEYASLDSRIVVVHKENGGEASARNLGLSTATGEYIMFIDSDDEYISNAVELLVSGLVSQGADLSIGGYLERRDKIEHFATGHLHKYTVQEFANIYLHSICQYDLPYIATTVNAKLFRRDVINDYDIHFDERFVIGNDAVFMCEYLNHINIIYDVLAPIYIYYKFQASERIQGMGWYYPDTFFLFAYVADHMISLMQPSETEYKELISKHYKDLLYALVNAVSNKQNLEHGLLPYLNHLSEEVKLFQLGARLDLTENYIQKEDGALPIRLISYMIVNKHYEALCTLFEMLCKIRLVTPYQGEYVRQMVHFDFATSHDNEKSNAEALPDKKLCFAEDSLLIEQIEELVTSTMKNGQLADDYALKVAELENRVIEAENRANVAETKAMEADNRADDAERRVKEADEYKMKYEGILESRCWKITKPIRTILNLLRAGRP